MEVILTHEHADFDALASLLAASKLFPQAIPVLPRKLNRNLRDFLVLYRGVLPFVRAEELPKRRVEQAIFVDTQTAQAVRGMTHNTPIRIIDHHSCERELPPHYHYWGEPVGATTTLLLEQLISRGINITPIEATLLLLGIYEDTGTLLYASTTPRDLRCAAWLLDRGANLEVVHDFLHHPLTPSQQRLLEALQEHAESYDIEDHLIVISCVKATEPVEEVSTLAHKMRDYFDPDGLFVIIDFGDRIQMVARSTTNHIHVGEIAEQFGGGGHHRAAAALIRNQSLEAVKSKLLTILPQAIRPAIKVRDIMSWGLRTIPPTMTVNEALQQMKRLGHEGFPVVEDGKLYGIVTRRIIDRAMHHNMHNEPVRNVMREGVVTVGIEDSVQSLQQKMMSEGWGQVPVVDEQGRLVGIVTRSDLLKLWATPEEERTPSSVALQMQTALPAGLLHLLRQIGEHASQLNTPTYAVGGFVRDLLLGFPNLDIDLVVEGSAAELAQALARDYGGRVRVHQRFGTAKWIRDEEAFAAGKALPDNTPSSVDFATARIEFYEEATALPVVEQSSIKLDLHRRDFTINTLAIRLDGVHWGELLDFYGGQQDLQKGIIRVLHSLSFVEDPTRILRAARFEQRFGFTIDSRTEELIYKAIDLLPRVSGSRIRHEINLILQEQQPEKALRRLHELGVWAQLDPDLSWNHRLETKFQGLRAALAAHPEKYGASERLYLALWFYHLDSAAHERLSEYLRLNAHTRALLAECQRIRALTPALLAPHLPNSELDRLLAPFSHDALLVARIATDDWTLRDRILDYEVHLRPQKIHLSGDMLKALGVPPGPIYRDIFQKVRAALLDGDIHSEEEELAMAKALLAEQTQTR
ncbi:MAG: CBS domain-containing protein [Chloroflexi bacterium]|nr:CBS domain-containing protein [Chloroflexota bacterium]